MFHEADHPNVPLSDWKNFKKSPSLIKEVIDRSETDLPEWFVPLARGVAIVSDHLVQKLPVSRFSQDWKRNRFGDYKRPMFEKWASLEVRQSGDKELWLIERFAWLRTYTNSDQVLVHLFGSTPIFARNYQTAMRLADYCEELDGSPLGLRWISACPNNIDGALKFARQCRKKEGRCAVNPPIKNQRH